jgi:hypothetical protein
LAGSSTGNTGRSPGVTPAGCRSATSRTSFEPQHLHNLEFKEELQTLGFRIGKVATFLKNTALDGEVMATPHKMANGTNFCLNWHTKGYCWSHCDNLNSHYTASETDMLDLAQFVEGGLSMIT